MKFIESKICNGGEIIINPAMITSYGPHFQDDKKTWVNLSGAPEDALLDESFHDFHNKVVDTLDYNSRRSAGN